MLSNRQWFKRYADFISWYNQHQKEIKVVEDGIDKAQQIEGFCGICKTPETFTQDTGFWKKGRFYYKESFKCPCGLNQRMRVLAGEVLEHKRAAGRKVLLEGKNEFRTALQKLVPNLEALSFEEGGDLTKLPFIDNSVGLLIHSEVLEHIPNTLPAFSETARVLTSRGVCLFTVPFSIMRQKTRIAATVNACGEVQHHMTPEYHFDGNGQLTPKHLVYKHFAWDIVEQAATFHLDAEIGVYFNPAEGFISSAQWISREFPIVIKMVKK